MPNTASALWPLLVAGTKAQASDVEAKFDFSEHNLWPHSTGTKRTNIYDLGDTDASWRHTYTVTINPTTTVEGVSGIVFGATTAVGTSTVAEFAGQLAVLLPRLTTAQRDALTTVNGMLIYNSDANQEQAFQNGNWEARGVPIGIIAKTSQFFSTQTSETMTAVTGSGRILQFSAGGGAGNTFSITVDSITVTLSTGAATRQYLVRTDNETTTTLGFTTTTQTTDIFFKSQFLVNGQAAASANTVSAFALFETS